jgi:quinol monooxygenase YgiN
MAAMNVVRFRVKPGKEQAFIDGQRSMRRDMAGFLGARLVRTGDRTFCMVGEWRSFKNLAAARPQMIAILDGFRGMLEDLGGGLGVTDPVSGEVVAKLTADQGQEARRTGAAKPAAKKKPAAKNAHARRQHEYVASVIPRRRESRAYKRWVPAFAGRRAPVRRTDVRFIHAAAFVAIRSQVPAGGHATERGEWTCTIVDTCWRARGCSGRGHGAHGAGRLAQPARRIPRPLAKPRNSSTTRSRALELRVPVQSLRGNGGAQT